MEDARLAHARVLPPDRVVGRRGGGARARFGARGRAGVCARAHGALHGAPCGAPGGRMIDPRPIALAGHGVRLEPMREDHAEGIVRAASDGALWELWYTSVPAPDEVASYIAAALA